MDPGTSLFAVADGAQHPVLIGLLLAWPTMVADGAGAGLCLQSVQRPARRLPRRLGRWKAGCRPGAGRRDGGGIRRRRPFGGSVVNSELLALPFILARLAAIVAASSAPRRRDEVAFAVLAGIAGTLAVLAEDEAKLDLFVVALVLVLLTRRA